MAIVVFIISLPVWYIVLRRYEEKLQLNDGLSVIVFILAIATAFLFAVIFPRESSRGNWTQADDQIERQSIEDVEQWENSRRR